MIQVTNCKVKFTGTTIPLPENATYPELEWCEQHPTQLTKQFFSKNYPIFYSWIMEAYPKDMRLSERLYRFYHPEADNKCKMCGKPTRYLSFAKGYSAHCSSKCSANNSETREKVKQTSLEKYGVESPNQAQSVKAKAKASFMERYGVENPRQYEAFKEKARQTSMKHYGTDHPMKNEEFKDKIKDIFKERYGVENPRQYEAFKEKSKQTCMERYGVEYTGQIPESREKFRETCTERYGVDSPLKNKEILQKVKDTNKEKYGVENPMQSECVRQRAVETNIEKYGVPYPMMIPEIRQKSTDTYRENRIAHSEFLLDYTDDNRLVCKCPHPECNACQERQYEVSNRIRNAREMNGIEPCTKLLPVQTSNMKDTSIELAIRGILDRYGIKYETSNRKILGGKELDIYIPSLNTAIECNGIYWHDDETRGANYHINKWKACQSKGIRLINLWEDWISTKLFIVERVLVKELGLDVKMKYGPEDIYICDIREDDAIEYINANSLYGYQKGDVYLGMRLNKTNEIVALVSFKRSRKHKDQEVDDSWDIISFAYSVPSDAEAMFISIVSDFISMYKPDNLYAYTCNDIIESDYMERAGFSKIGEPEDVQWYIGYKGYNKFHRIKASKVTKNIVISQGLAPDPDPSKWTVSEAMEENGWARVSDSGWQKWKANLPKQSI